ncbi:MAG: hypothetical protein AAGH65_07020 [Pseudomonadota bacterium]
MSESSSQDAVQTDADVSADEPTSSKSSNPTHHDPSGERVDFDAAAQQGPSGGTNPLGTWAFLFALIALVLATQPWWPGNHSSAGNEADSSEGRFVELTAEFDQLRLAQDAIRRDMDGQFEQQQSALMGLESSMDQETELMALEASIQSMLAAELSAMNERLAEVEGRQNTQQGAVQARMDGLEERAQRQIEQLGVRLDQFDSSLQNTDRNLAERLSLLQVDALLTMGQDRLELERNSAAAVLAWDRAASRLEVLDSSVFDPLKETIAAEQARLAAFHAGTAELDSARRYAQLMALSDHSARWPTVAQEPDVTMSIPDESADGWSDRLGQALGSLVRIEHVDQALPSSIEIEQAQARIRNQLRSAASATSQADWALNRLLIESTEADIRAINDLQTDQVVQALDQLALLKAEPARRALPELGASREQVRRLLEQSQ